LKKIVLVEAGLLLLLAGVMTLLLLKTEPKDVSIEAVESAFMNKCAFDQMEQAGDMRLKRAFSLNAADYDGYLYFTPNNTMSVDEFLVIKLQEDSQADAVLSAIDYRLATQKRNFDGYGVDQTDLLNNATILQDGNYIVFAVGDGAETWVNIVRKVWEQ